MSTIITGPWLLEKGGWFRVAGVGVVIVDKEINDINDTVLHEATVQSVFTGKQERVIFAKDIENVCIGDTISVVAADRGRAIRVRDIGRSVVLTVITDTAGYHWPDRHRIIRS